jgi:hypothetical protein
MSRHADEHDDGSDKPVSSAPTRPVLRLVSSTDANEAFEASDEGVRKPLRAPPAPSAWDDEDDPGPSAA